MKPHCLNPCYSRTSCISYSLLNGLVISCPQILHFMLLTLKNTELKLCFWQIWVVDMYLNTKNSKKPLQNTASQLLDIHVLKKWSCATKFQLLNKSWKRQEGAWIILAHFPFKYMKYFKKLSHKKALFCGTNTLNVVNGFVPLFLQKAHTKRYFILAAAD